MKSRPALFLVSLLIYMLGLDFIDHRALFLVSLLIYMLGLDFIDNRALFLVSLLIYMLGLIKRLTKNNALLSMKSRPNM
jgi:hypothetical protein